MIRLLEFVVPNRKRRRDVELKHMHTVITDLAYLMLCHILGWAMTGYFVVRVFAGKDIRAQGSGNIGAMNSGRVAGAKGFILTFAGDFLKGVLAIGLGVMLQLPSVVLFLGLAAVVTGHIWPAPFRFRGGKGISTFAGGLLVLSPLHLLVLLALAAVFYVLLREFTAAGLIALIFWPAISFFPEKNMAGLLISLILTGIILYAHRSNIRNYRERHSKGR